MNERDEHLAARLGTALPSERAAMQRNWAAIAAAVGAPARPRRGTAGTLATTIALAVVVVAVLGWWEGGRVDVAGDRLPVLYREEISRTAVTARGIEGSLAIQQKRIEGDARLRVVGITDVRIAADRLPASIELRFQRLGDDAYGILARSELSEPRRSTDSTRTLYEAPFPPLARREQATYRVWLHLDTAAGPVESPFLVIAVTDRPEGQRGTAGGTP